MALAVVLGFAAWLLRAGSRFGCQAYFSWVTSYRAHPLELGEGPWSERSSLAASTYAAVCLNVWPAPVVDLLGSLGSLGALAGVVTPWPAAPVQVVDEVTKAFVVDGFLSAEDCRALRELSAGPRGPLFAESGMQASRDADFRTSSTAAFTVEEEMAEPLLARLLARIHLYARMPLRHGEMLQVARYRGTEKYELHRDSDNTVRRLATAIVYLSESGSGLRGGETIFPMSGPLDPSKPRAVAVDLERIAHGFEVKLRPLAELCGEREGVLIEPKEGRLALFYNLGNPWQKPNGDVNVTLDAYHGSCPVTAGEKWIFQRWMHVKALPDQLAARSK